MNVLAKKAKRQEGRRRPVVPKPRHLCCSDDRALPLHMQGPIVATNPRLLTKFAQTISPLVGSHLPTVVGAQQQPHSDGFPNGATARCRTLVLANINSKNSRWNAFPTNGCRPISQFLPSIRVSDTSNFVNSILVFRIRMISCSDGTLSSVSPSRLIPECVLLVLPNLTQFVSNQKVGASIECLTTKRDGSIKLRTPAIPWNH